MACYLLFVYLNIAFLVGVAIIVIFIPFNIYISSLISSTTSNFLAAKDSRLSFICAVLRGMTSVKMQQYENAMNQASSSKRSTELYYLKQRKYLDCIYVFLWAFLPVLVPLATFIVAVFTLKEALTVADVFFSISLLKMLIFPLNSIPWVVNSIIESSISLCRLQNILRFRRDDEHNPHSAAFLEEVAKDEETKEDNEMSDTAIILDEAIFRYSSTKSASSALSEGGPGLEDTVPLLEDADDVKLPSESSAVGPISLSASYGEVIAFVGPVGSGKFSIIYLL